MLQAQGPLLKPASANAFGIFWQAANELMLHAGEGIGTHYFDQNRTLAGVVISPNRKLELAVLYQFIVQYLPAVKSQQYIHSLRLSILHQLDFRRADE